MSQALYLKYRPKNFSEIRGQEEVVEVLSGAIKEGNVSHAYLFAGSRGTGKTSIARIFAKEIGSKEMDIYEIDAASNRGIDEVRELRDAARTLPYESEYKIYIIDEVHMLTTPAFNALLKTLEEPPAHVIFILATTEMGKLPDTVISRCEVHRFRRPSQKILKGLIKDVVKSEGYQVDEASDDLIALLGDGSFRDTLGVLQKIMRALPEKKITAIDVARITGAPAPELVNQVLESVSTSDLGKGLKAVSDALGANIDMNLFMTLVLAKVRAVLLLRNAPEMKEELREEFSDADFSFLGELAEGKVINSEALKALLEAHAEMAYAKLSHLPLELALIKLSGGEKGV
jgi:DNA polymerase-3 subunit gamma/tau